MDLTGQRLCYYNRTLFQASVLLTCPLRRLVALYVTVEIIHPKHPEPAVETILETLEKSRG